MTTILSQGSLEVATVGAHYLAESLMFLGGKLHEELTTSWVLVLV